MMRVAWLAVLVIAFAGCERQAAERRVVGQSSFASAPQGGRASNSRGGQYGAADTNGSAPAADPGAKATGTPTRAVEETDLYRLEGNRLYYLNGYRGLMVFDVSDVDHPTLLGRSPIYGWPVDMIVRNGVAIVVVGDWYGQMDDGTPFHGSIVRGLDATNPANIQVLGEARLGGFVRDDRVVGDVIYAVSEDYGWWYGWGPYTQPQEQIIVSSVSFANNVIQSVSSKAYPGYAGVFNVTSSSILMAHDFGYQYGYNTPAQTELLYLDISDPAGAIVQRGAITVAGRVQGWGADNGRWNLDFADGKTAHVIGCASGPYYWCDGSSYVLNTVDFTSPDQPVLDSTLSIAGTGWSIAARFDSGRLYLSPGSWYYGSTNGTPFQVYDLTNPMAPRFAGSASIPGTVWNILPAPQQRIFALGNDWGGSNGSGDTISLKYLDVTDPNSPALIGTSSFGQGWAWTPAAGTFKAFTMDAAKGLVVLPFSGWSSQTDSYLNGLQLIEFTPTSERTAGAAKTRGWVERGIFVGNRLVSLSDISLSVVDYADHDAPTVTAELTLARNVIAAQPQGTTIAEVSTDWWDNDVTASEVRILPIANADETTDVGSIPSVFVEGTNARVFRNGDLAYVVTNVRVNNPTCQSYGYPYYYGCYNRSVQVQVVDLANGGAVLRGKAQLPADPWGWYGWGWWGYYWWDWFDGSEVVQVAGDALAFRRWEPIWDANGYYVDSNSALFVVDLANPDAPGVASVVITTDPDGWWGNMRMVGSTLYTTHYEWYQRPTDSTSWLVKYYASRIDLTDRAHPVVKAKINVPGLVIGGSPTNPSLLYTIDYRWDNDLAKNDFDVVQVQGNSAVLVSKTEIDGWVGNVFVRGNKAYLSAQQYDHNGGYYYWGGNSIVNLHEIDLTNPWSPVDRIASPQAGWGWLLGVEGDRAIVSSGWGADGVDIYTLVPGQTPVFTQFARTRGWWPDSITRQGNSLFIATGYWGVERIDLQ